METQFFSGMGLVVIAGICAGIFALPFNANKKWEWENNWIIWSVVALVIGPWLVSFATVPNLLELYRVESDVLYLVLLFGIIWGVGAILWGLGMHYLGIALSVPIMAGLNNSVGTLMPIVIRNPAELLEPTGLQIISGVVVLLVGILIVSYAGTLKEKILNKGQAEQASGNRFLIGIGICIAAGLIGPMINFGFVFGEPLRMRAIEFGASATFSSNAIWSIVLTGGFIANFGYCIYLLKKNKTAVRFKQVNKGYWLLAALAGVLWYASVMFYGMGSTNLGKLGASVGWATMQSLAIISANVVGLLIGEWAGVGRKPVGVMSVGVTFLAIGVGIIAFSG